MSEEHLLEVPFVSLLWVWQVCVVLDRFGSGEICRGRFTSMLMILDYVMM